MFMAGSTFGRKEDHMAQAECTCLEIYHAKFTGKLQLECCGNHKGTTLGMSGYAIQSVECNDLNF